MDELELGNTIKGFTPGQKVFARYTLTRILGRGGMGVVWLARDDKLERDVALKFLPEVMMGDKLALADLKRETRRSLDLTHSHIVRIYDFMEDGRTAAIAMEYIAGETLTNARVERPGHCYEPADIGKWVGQLCSALDYAHTKAKVVHRDLKPANLMIDAAGDLKVTDFGIATSIADSVSRVSKQAGSSGTPVYMSPQQMMGEKSAVTDDIYALGTTLYDLLTGKPPFYSGNIVLQVQNKVAPALAERRAALGVSGEPIPTAWQETIAACIAKDPKDRPQSAGEVAARLGLASSPNAQRPTSNAQHSSAEKVERGVPTRSEPVQRPGSTSKAPLYLGVAAAVLVLGGLGWYFGIHAPEQKRLAEIARLESEKKTEEANRLRTEQEKIAAEAKARTEEEQKAYALIVAGIDTFVDGAPAAMRARTDAAVKNYLAGAPARFRAEVETRWSARQTAWEIALEKEQARLAAERLANARGGVVVRTNPSGAEVRVGAIALDKSPFTLKDQKLGKYPVRVRLVGYEEWAGEVEVKENEFTDLDVVLKRSTGRVVLTGTTGAIVTTEGRILGSLPLTLDSVPTGAVRYAVLFKGHKQAEVSGEVPRNAELRLTVLLEKQNYPQPGQTWENTLGQRFVPVPGTNVLFCVWESRVQDFEAFVRETGHTTTTGMSSDRGDGWKQQGDTWKSPGFPQGPTHPVVGVTQAEAQAFCLWLTEKERREDKLGPDQSYRLPTNAEWDVAAGGAEFPWGNQWPPPHRSGNYADDAAKRGRFKIWTITPGYEDGHDVTAPVGTFPANRYGIHDLGGNVWEYISDQPHGKRGASFATLVERVYLASSYRDTVNSHYVNIGFRVVCVVGPAR